MRSETEPATRDDAAARYRDDDADLATRQDDATARYRDNDADPATRQDDVTAGNWDDDADPATRQDDATAGNWDEATAAGGPDDDADSTTPSDGGTAIVAGEHAVPATGVAPVTGDGAAPATQDEVAAAEFVAAAETGFQERWREIQLRFVDDPSDAASEAERLVGEAIDTITATLSSRKTEIDAWGTAEQPDTEELRLVIRRYRELLDQLVSLAEPRH
jgi:hypothetical protein